MNLDETPAEIAARSQMATALQQLGHALVGHRVDSDLAHEVAAIARDLTATLTRATLELVAPAGHLPWLDEPERAAAHVRAFLASSPQA